MTLHQFLSDNQITLPNNREKDLGVLVANTYVDQYGQRPPKTLFPNIEGKVNDYPEEFLQGCIETIIQFLAKLQEKTTVNG